MFTGWRARGYEKAVGAVEIASRLGISERSAYRIMAGAKNGPNVAGSCEDHSVFEGMKCARPIVWLDCYVESIYKLSRVVFYA